MLKTNDIVYILRTMKKWPFNRDNLIKSKSDGDERLVDLSRIRLHDFDALVETGLIKAKSPEMPVEGLLTDYGSKILAEYEDASEKYGSNNVEIIPKNVEGYGKYTFGINVKPRAKKEYKARISEKSDNLQTQPKSSISKEIEEKRRKQNIVEEKLVSIIENLEENKNIRGWTKKDDYYVLNTKVPFYRTLNEIDKLKETAQLLGTNLSSSGNECEKVYNFEMTGLRVVSRKDKKKRGLNSYQPISIVLDPTLHAVHERVNEKFIITILEKLKRKF